MELGNRPLNDAVEEEIRLMNDAVGTANLRSDSEVANLRQEITTMSRFQEELKNEIARLSAEIGQHRQENGERMRRVADNVNNAGRLNNAGFEDGVFAAAQATVAPEELNFIQNVEQGITKAGEVLHSIDQLLLQSSVAGILSTLHVDKVVAIVVFIDLTAICYIEKCITIKLDYDPNIVERLRQSTERYRIRETYYELFTTINNLHEMLHNAILNGGRGLPDSAGIKMLLDEIDIDANYYYTINSQLNSEIEVALKTLKDVKSWAKPIFVTKTAGASVALGGCTYGAFLVYFHSDERSLTSWFDWRAGTLGVMAAILTSVYVLRKLDSPKTEEEWKKLTSDINKLEKMTIEFKALKQFLEQVVMKKLKTTVRVGYPQDHPEQNGT